MNNNSKQQCNKSLNFGEDITPNMQVYYLSQTKSFSSKYSEGFRDVTSSETITMVCKKTMITATLNVSHNYFINAPFTSMGDFLLEFS